MKNLVVHMNPIELKKSLGPVVFLGGINAMPMMYALELRKRGIKVLYFVDRPSFDTLSRPENHFDDIGYPYPDWIVEWILPTQILLPLFPRLFALILAKKISKVGGGVPQALVLNGFFCSLTPYFFNGVPKVFLPGGSDLDSWADVDGAANLGQSFAGRSIFKFLPKNISVKIIKKIVKTQFFGAENCEKVLYFPSGFNKAGDRVLEKLQDSGVVVIPRYDISFEPLKYEERGVVRDQGRLIIFSGVRFLFKTFPDGNRGYNKGNDLIIRGLAEYYRINKNIEIHFVEKGEDVEEAKKLCADLGIHEVVIWHKEMKFSELLQLYRIADVCFDQVGKHWIGAIGFYALFLGKPLIANDELAIRSGVWNENAPILRANTPEAIKNQLIKINSLNLRREVKNRSMAFADATLGPNKAMSMLFQICG